MIRKINEDANSRHRNMVDALNNSYSKYGSYYVSVARFFMARGYDISNDDVFNYIDGVVQLMNHDPDMTYLKPSEWLVRWYKDTKRNFPEDIKWLESTK